MAATKRSSSATRNTKAGKRPPATRARAKRSSATRVPRLPRLEQRHLDLLGLGCVALGVFLAFPLYLAEDAGRGGDAVTDGLAAAIGALRFGAPPAIVAIGALLVLKPVLPSIKPFRAGGICLLLSLSLGLAAGTLGLGPGDTRTGWWEHGFVLDRGGYLGEALHYGTSTLLGTIGAHIVALFLFAAALLLLTGASVAGVVKATHSGVAETTRTLRTKQAVRDRPPEVAPEPKRVTKRKPKPVAEPELDGHKRFSDLFEEDDPTATKGSDPVVAVEPTGEREPEPEPAPEPKAEQAKPKPKVVKPDPGDQLALDEQAFVVPQPTMLKRSTGAEIKPDTSGQAQTAARLLEALQHFNIDADVVGTVAGPHITRYELRLAPGIKMSKVAQLKDDLAYALAAVDIRILAPIPGKRAVGVEVPNKHRRLVHLGDVFEEPPAGASPLFVWLGKDVSGKAIGADLAKMPHLLVAGTTGAGKSACINGLLSSVLLRATPEDARLVLIDPKQVELNHYEAVPHLLTPVITSPRQAANALQNLVREMEWRYGIMSMAKTRSLPELNKHRVRNGDEPLPYILCVIDELADLMMVAPADVEDSIVRIAQKARAVGMHLVLATQSPRVTVITGLIKANVPSRIAFSVSSQTDSRVILDEGGAESLLGQGDMLFSPIGSSKLQRIQGAYIDEPQIASITEFWARQGEPEMREDLLEEVESEQPDTGPGDPDALDPDEDPMLGEAIQLVVEMGTASTSMIQRRLRLGYTRAGRLIDMLERRGVISGYEGSKPRQVLITESDLPRVLSALKERGDDVGPAEPELPPVPVPGDDLPDSPPE